MTSGRRLLCAPCAVLLVVLSVVVGQGRLEADTCRQLNVSESELPRHGGHGGIWLSDGRLALTDFVNHQPLVYDLDDGTVRRMGPKEEPDLGGGPHYTLGMSSANGRIVVTWASEVRFEDGVRLLRLDSKLNPANLYSWPEDWGETIHPENLAEGTGLPVDAESIAGTQDGLVALVGFRERRGIMQFALPESAAGAAAIPTGFWPEMETEAHPQAPLLVQLLAATLGEDGHAYALRVDDGGPFLQRLEGRGERLEVFPPMAGPMPDLPSLREMGDYPRWWRTMENASFPAALYAEGPFLYVLMRVATDEGPEWTLHAVDPVAESLLHTVRLPTRAVHISLVPGPDQWALLEGVRHAEDEMRRPVGLLLLDSETIRSGGQLTCG